MMKTAEERARSFEVKSRNGAFPVWPFKQKRSALAAAKVRLAKISSKESQLSIDSHQPDPHLSRNRWQTPAGSFPHPSNSPSTLHAFSALLHTPTGPLTPPHLSSTPKAPRNAP